MPTILSADAPDGLHYYFLNSFAGMRRLVFFGFSYTDPFVRKIITQCGHNLWLDGTPVHFLVTGIFPGEETNQMDFAKDLIGHGIELVCFQQPEGKYTAFQDAIEYLGYVGPKIGSQENRPETKPKDRKIVTAFAQKDEKFL
jgi:hypothetical protein